MANPTTNYGWPMPTSTDLVTDLPADFALFGQPVDTSLKALNPETTLGDIAYRSSTSNTNTRLGIGSTSQVLTVVAGVPAWATPTGGSTFAGVSVLNSAVQSLTNDTWTAITMNTERFDTDAYHSIVTNTSRLTVPAGKAGYYGIYGQLRFAANSTGQRNIAFYKNGVAQNISLITLPSASLSLGASMYSVLSLAVADYVEFFGFQNSGGALDANATDVNAVFVMTYLGA